MADLDKVKRNVQKMVSMNAPETDIDQYISGEGVSIDEVRNHKIGSVTQTNPVQQSVQSMKSGIRSSAEKLNRGSIVGGTAQTLNTGFETAFSPFTMADQKIRSMFPAPNTDAPRDVFSMQTAGNVVNAGLDVASLIPQLLSGVGSGLTKAGIGLYGGVAGHNLGTSPENAGDIYREVPKLGGNIATVGLPSAIGKYAPKVTPMVKEAVNNSRIEKGMKEIKDVAPPTSKELNYDQHLKTASKYIAEQERLTPINPKAELSPIRQAVDNVKQAKERLWNDKIAPVISQHGNVLIDGGEIANSIRGSISSYTKKHDPSAVSALEDYARTFEKYDANGNKVGNIEIPISDLNTYVTELNARTSAFQKALPDVQALTENARPKIKGEVIAVEKMRELLYDKLDQLGNPEVKQLKKDYGSLMQIQKAIERKVVPTERGKQSGSFYETPFGMAVKTTATLGTAAHNLPLAAAGGSMALLQRYLIGRNKPNPKITRGFERLGKSNLQP